MHGPAECAKRLNPPPHALAWLGRAELIPRTRGLASAPPSPSGSPHAAEQFPRQPLSALVSPLGPCLHLRFQFWAPLGLALPYLVPSKLP